MVKLSDQLKGLDVNREQLDDLILLNEQGNLLRNGYERAQIDIPDWLSGALDTLQVEIGRQTRDRLELRLKELDQAANTLKTAAERRVEIAEERAKLERKLGRTPVTQ